jgi:hypothetical protein
MLMKIITIPDLHGKDYWKDVNFSNYDKVIFLGDYADSSSIASEQIIHNLTEIIDVKKEFPEKVELLLGNHDIQYLYYPAYYCTGFNKKDQPFLTKLFNENRLLFNFAFQKGNHLWSHAGVSQSWFNENLNIFKKFILSEGNIHSGLAYILNQMADQYIHVLDMCSYYRGGNSLYGGILWADMKETSKDMLSGMFQYVGHSRVASITRLGDAQSGILYLDCLDTSRNFYVLELNENEER